MAFSEQALLRLLEQHHINYIVRTHEPIFTVAEGIALGLPNVQAAVKSLLLTDDKRSNFYLVILPLDKRLDLKELRAKIGSRRLTMASAEELAQLLELTPGAVTLSTRCRPILIVSLRTTPSLPTLTATQPLSGCIATS